MVNAIISSTTYFKILKNLPINLWIGTEEKTEKYSLEDRDIVEYNRKAKQMRTEVSNTTT